MLAFILYIFIAEIFQNLPTVLKQTKLLTVESRISYLSYDDSIPIKQVLFHMFKINEL